MTFIFLYSTIADSTFGDVIIKTENISFLFLFPEAQLYKFKHGKETKDFVKTNNLVFI